MLSQDIRITKQLEDARFVDGKVVPHVRVEFYVGDHGPFSVHVPKDDFQNGARDMLVENYARNVRT